MGAIDRLGFLLVPLLFGRGLPLFPLNEAADQPQLELVEQHAYRHGTLGLHYALPARTA
jgi:hypothetical protein